MLLPLTIQMSVQTVLVHPRSKWLSSFTRSGSKHDCIIPAPPPVRLDIHKIRQQSHHSQVVAAMHLGISLTALKVACRQLGVVSWTSLREESSDTQPAAPSATGGQGAPDDAAQAPQTQDVIYWKEEIDANDVHEPADLRVIGEKAGICNMNIGETIKQGQATSHHQTPDVAACKQNHAVGCTLSSLSQHPAGPTPNMVPRGHVHDQEQGWQTTSLGWQPTELGWTETMMSSRATPGVQPPFLSPPCANDHGCGLWQPPSRCQHNGGPHCPVSIARTLGLRFDFWRGEWVIDDCAAAAGTHPHPHPHTHTHIHTHTPTHAHAHAHAHGQ